MDCLKAVTVLMKKLIVIFIKLSTV